jgi:hypothetical protein
MRLNANDSTTFSSTGWTTRERERERESMGYLTALLKGDREKEKESERK